MMIVEKRPFVAVLAAFAWLGLVYLWHTSTAGAPQSSAAQSSQVADLDRVRTASSIGPLLD